MIDDMIDDRWYEYYHCLILQKTLKCCQVTCFNQLAFLSTLELLACRKFKILESNKSH